MLGTFDISGSALTTSRLRLDVISNNIANVETTTTAEGGPYQRRSVVLSDGSSNSFARTLQNQMNSIPGAQFNGTAGAGTANGVMAERIARDPSPPDLRHEPDHPDANEDGYVAYPNVDLVHEMTDLLMANRTYQANASAFDVSKNMVQSTLRMGG